MKEQTKEKVNVKQAHRLELANWFLGEFNTFLKDNYLTPLDEETYPFSDTHENNEWEFISVQDLILKCLDKLENTHKIDILINPDDMAFDIENWSSSFDITSYGGSWTRQQFTHKGITYKLQIAIY